MPRITLSGYEAHYQQQGRGPDVILLHGFTSNLAMWVFSGLVARLAKRFRVTSYDFRGHGASSAPVSGYTSATLADDLAELHDKLGLGPAILIGHSLGGTVAMHAALAHPALVAAVILSDSYFPGLAALEPHMPQADVWVRLQTTMKAAGQDIGPEVDFRRLLDVISNLSNENRAVLQEKLGAPAARWLSQLAPLATTNAAEETFQAAGLTETAIASIEQPVIAMYDEETPFIATYEWLLDNLPDCTGVRVPGASHLALLENPEEFAALVDRSLTELVQRLGLADASVAEAAKKIS